MIRRILFLVLLLVASFVALVARASGAGTVLSGIVRDSEGQPIGGATISLTVRSKEFGFAAATDAAGRYQFRAITPGEYRFRVDHPDYATCNMTLSIGEGGTRQMDVVLPPAVGKAKHTARATQVREGAHHGRVPSPNHAV